MPAFKSAVKYLGVMMEAKLSYKQHVQSGCDKAFTVSMAHSKHDAEYGRTTVLLFFFSFSYSALNYSLQQDSSEVMLCSYP